MGGRPLKASHFRSRDHSHPTILGKKGRKQSHAQLKSPEGRAEREGVLLLHGAGWFRVQGAEREFEPSLGVWKRRASRSRGTQDLDSRKAGLQCWARMT